MCDRAVKLYWTVSDHLVNLVQHAYRHSSESYLQLNRTVKRFTYENEKLFCCGNK